MATQVQRHQITTTTYTALGCFAATPLPASDEAENCRRIAAAVRRTAGRLWSTGRSSATDDDQPGDDYDGSRDLAAGLRQSRTSAQHGGIHLQPGAIRGRRSKQGSSLSHAALAWLDQLPNLAAIPVPKVSAAWALFIKDYRWSFTAIAGDTPMAFDSEWNDISWADEAGKQFMATLRSDGSGS
jgi:hypothetical protein